MRPRKRPKFRLLILGWRPRDSNAAFPPPTAVVASRRGTGAAGRHAGGRGWLALAALVGLAVEPPAPGPVFPRDHGRHPEGAIEWWYYTGHLRGAEGGEYGFQLTFFRARELSLAHFAWTDVARKEFR